MPTISLSQKLILLPFLREDGPVPACADPRYDPDWWHPGPGQILSLMGNAAKAQAICWACPLRKPCAEYAVGAEETGIWGAMIPSELEAARRCRRGKCLHPEHRWSNS